MAMPCEFKGTTEGKNSLFSALTTNKHREVLMAQTALRPEDEFRQLLLSKLPPTIARKDVERQLGGIITPKTLANADSSGDGPLGAFQVGRSVVYPTESLVNWLIGTMGVSRLKNNIKEL